MLSALAIAADLPVVKIKKSAAPNITLDGRLTEPVWRDAPVIRLTQQSPKPGAPTTYDTEVRIIVASDKLYFGFTCHDPQPNRIAVHSLQRDPDLSGDDFVSVILDPYQDHRTGYFFQINAAGLAKTD
jgi:hypothetical protein